MVMKADPAPSFSLTHTCTIDKLSFSDPFYPPVDLTLSQQLTFRVGAHLQGLTPLFSAKYYQQRALGALTPTELCLLMLPWTPIVFSNILSMFVAA